MNKKRVLVTGTFDMLHSGHFNILYNASKLGDVYVLIRKRRYSINKKNKDVLQDDMTRLENISKISFVKSAALVSYELEENLTFVNKWKIDTLVIGEDHRNTKFLDDFCKKGKLNKIIYKRTPGISSSLLRERIKNE